ncbi:MAG: hypothetical protein AB8W16_01305, partial [Coxiella endosymbiont of Dermacentor silvarum]
CPCNWQQGEKTISVN